MKFESVPLSEAIGKILGHNIAGRNGQRLLRKGKRLTDEDVENLRLLGRHSVYVAQFEESDVDENTAARRVAAAVCGSGLYMAGASSGRANLLAGRMGLLRIDVERLAQINELEGITLSTLLTHSPVHARQIVATVKIIPYAVPEATLSLVEAISSPVRGTPASKEADGASASRPVVRVDALPFRDVGMILSGSTSLHQRLVTDFAPLRERIERLGSSVARTDFVALDEESDEAALASEQLRTLGR